jgi:hypothetical protein
MVVAVPREQIRSSGDYLIPVLKPGPFPAREMSGILSVGIQIQASFQPLEDLFKL